MKRSMNWFCRCLAGALLLFARSDAWAEPREIPDVLKPWQDWVTWDAPHLQCPTQYDSAEKHICIWPSRLVLAADPSAGSWTLEVTAYEESWLALPGSAETWPRNVRVDGEVAVVVARDGLPTTRVPEGRHQLTGEFAWDEMPQRIAVPAQVGFLSLTVEGKIVSIPNWDASNDVWLKRQRAEVADKNQIAVQVYRILEDGIPMWLRTEIELTVSGQSREEDLGWILPQDWRLSQVDSPIPAAVDELGRMKAQVRAGKWTIRVDAFRTTDLDEFRFAPDATPITDQELIGFKADSGFRTAELQGIQAIDVTQTTFPAKWRDLPVYQWATSSSFRLTETMRGMGLQRPEGLRVERRFWLDEDGKGLTYRDRIQGQMQQIWRLDVAAGHELGAVRVDGQPQLITANPQSGARGVEIRTRNLNLEAIGRAERTAELSATGWQAGADALGLTLVLPPGWRVFALFGADRVDGDWLTAWSLLDLFLLLIFSLAVFRLWGVSAGMVALLAFGLSYHEPDAPRLTWLFLLIPIALLRVVPVGAARRWISAWRYVAIAALVVCLIPFLALQIQSTIYPQLEHRGIPYAPRGMFRWLGIGSRAPVDARVAMEEFQDYAQSPSLGDTLSQGKVADQVQATRARFASSNLMYDLSAKIQTGPAEPEWDWNQVRCQWNSPVSATQQIRPILVSLPLHRLLTILRLALLLGLVAIMLGMRKVGFPFLRRLLPFVVVCGGLGLTPAVSAQIPDPEMLNTLRQRLLEPSDAYPHAAEISSVQLRLDAGRMQMEAEIHAAIAVAVPLPGRLPAWSPVSVRVDQEPNSIVCRRDEYLWVTVPKGVHRVVVEGLLPDATDWEWTFLLRPRRVAIDAPDWTVTGVRANGVPEAQVFFSRQQQLSAGEAAYDRKDFNAIVAVDRHLEIGLIWQLRNAVTRLSSMDKAVSFQVPLLPGERVLTSNMVVENGLIEVKLAAGQNEFSWESELPVGDPIRLDAPQTDRWVERWHLVTSPVWNVALTGLSPVFEPQQQQLIPVWHPWPGEGVALSFSKPEAVSGDLVTVKRVEHETALGRRERTSTLELDVECSLGGDFVIEFDPDAEISSLSLAGQSIPVRRDGGRLIVPARPGRQTIELAWRTADVMRTWAGAGTVRLPVAGSNVTTVLQVPDSRWVLWAHGPLRGPAVRFWTILACAVLAAWILGSLPQSPLTRFEWILLAIGLTQVHVIAALIVVAWLFALMRRGKLDPEGVGPWRFNFLQIGLVLLTLLTLAILITAVGEGLLGDPEMFVIGNNSSRTYLRWFQPRVGVELPAPSIVSISVWYYRLLMLLWRSGCPAPCCGG